MRKPLVILLNKTDLVPQGHVEAWLRYLRAAFPSPLVHIIPFSACAAAIPPGAGMAARRRAIKDARGRVLVSRNQPGGSETEVAGKPPFSVVIGNAPEVRLVYNDRDVDLEPHTRVAVARLTLP